MLTKAAWKQFVVALIIWLRVVDQGLAELVVAISEGWGSTDPGWYKQAGAGAARNLFNILVNKWGMPLPLQAVVDAAVYSGGDGIEVLRQLCMQVNTCTNKFTFT